MSDFIRSSRPANILSVFRISIPRTLSAHNIPYFVANFVGVVELKSGKFWVRFTNVKACWEIKI